MRYYLTSKGQIAAMVRKLEAGDDVVADSVELRAAIIKAMGSKGNQVRLCEWNMITGKQKFVAEIGA